MNIIQTVVSRISSSLISSVINMQKEFPSDDWMEDWLSHAKMPNESGIRFHAMRWCKNFKNPLVMIF